MCPCKHVGMLTVCGEWRIGECGMFPSSFVWKFIAVDQPRVCTNQECVHNRSVYNQECVHMSVTSPVHHTSLHKYITHTHTHTHKSHTSHITHSPHTPQSILTSRPYPVPAWEELWPVLDISCLDKTLRLTQRHISIADCYHGTQVYTCSVTSHSPSHK